MPRKKTFSADFALDKAMEVFCERGFSNTSMQEVAAATGMSRSIIYATFGDRHALLLQALRRHVPAITPELSEPRGVHSSPAALVSLFESAIAGGEQRGVLRVLINAVMMESRPASESELAGIFEDAVLDMERYFRGAVEQGKSVGQIADSVEPVETARVLLSLYLGLLMLARFDALREPVLSAVKQQVVTLLPSEKDAAE